MDFRPLLSDGIMYDKSYQQVIKSRNYDLVKKIFSTYLMSRLPYTPYWLGMVAWWYGGMVAWWHSFDCG